MSLDRPWNRLTAKEQYDFVAGCLARGWTALTIASKVGPSCTLGDVVRVQVGIEADERRRSRVL